MAEKARSLCLDNLVLVLLLYAAYDTHIIWQEAMRRVSKAKEKMNDENWWKAYLAELDRRVWEGEGSFKALKGLDVKVFSEGVYPTPSGYMEMVERWDRLNHRNS